MTDRVGDVAQHPAGSPIINPELNPEFDLELEKHKYHAEFQYRRLLVGLSTGAVIAIATLLRDLFPQPIAKWLLIVTVFGFSVSVIANMLFLSFYTEHIVVREHKTRWIVFLERLPLSRSGEVFFFLGLISLSIFIIYNFYALEPGPATTSPQIHGPF